MLCSVPHTYAIGTYRVRTYAQQVHIFIVQSYQIILIQQNNLRKILTKDVKNIYFSFIISLQKILVNYCATTYLFLFRTPIAHRYTPFSPSQAPLFYHRTAECLHIIRYRMPLGFMSPFQGSLVDGHGTLHMTRDRDTYLP